jgi:hypothetical protein
MICCRRSEELMEETPARGVPGGICNIFGDSEEFILIERKSSDYWESSARNSSGHHFEFTSVRA